MFVLKGKIVCAHICTSTCLYVYVYRKMDYIRERERGREGGGKEEESGDTRNQSCLTEFKLNVCEHGP